MNEKGTAFGFQWMSRSFSGKEVFKVGLYKRACSILRAGNSQCQEDGREVRLEGKPGFSPEFMRGQKIFMKGRLL